MLIDRTEYFLFGDVRNFMESELHTLQFNNELSKLDALMKYIIELITLVSRGRPPV